MLLPHLLPVTVIQKCPLLQAYMFMYWVTCSVLVSTLVWYHNYRLHHQSSEPPPGIADNHEQEPACSNASNERATQPETSVKGGAHTTSASADWNCPKRGKAINSPDQDALPNQAPSCLSITARKHFHIVAIVTFLPGIVLDCPMANMAGTCAIVVFTMLEVRMCVQDAMAF